MTNKLLHSRRESGAAIVVTLCILVLLSVLVLAYFSKATLQRQISFSSAGQARAQAVGQAALETILGDLRAEIHSGSQSFTESEVSTFTPTSNHRMVPARMEVLPDLNNLVKWSGTKPFWPQGNGFSAPGPVRAADNNSSTTASANGRYIDIARWERPQMGTVFTPANTPSWVLLTRSGPLEDAATASLDLAKLSDLSPSNADAVIGRFAFAVYDVSGLLDVAAAGFPSTASSQAIGRKGSQGYADLRQLGLGNQEIATLVDWRNVASRTNYDDYISTFAKGKGFLQAAPGDRGFLGRQDFLEFWKNRISTNQDLSKFFTTFSREANTPSWGPQKNASDWGGYNSGNLYSYKTVADNASAVNRFFPNVRVKQTFTRQNGETAEVGEPLVRSRFDLSKLSWLRHDGTLPSGVTEADILANFGLTRSTAGAWVYNHGADDRILTLDEVAERGREPDFFELLQAGLLQGGLGLLSGNPSNSGNDVEGGEYYRQNQISWRTPLVRTDRNGALVNSLPKYQVIQIGANIIDQADTDGFPTEIILNGEAFYGIENLPYLNALGDTALRPSLGTPFGPNDYQAYVHRWITPSFWNPHQNAQTPPAVGPQRIRLFIGRGEARPRVHNLGEGAIRDFSSAPGWIATNISDQPNRFAEPATIGFDAAEVSDTKGKIRTNLGWERAGIYVGYSYSPDHPDKVSASADLVAAGWTPPTLGYYAAVLAWTAPMTVELQYRDPATGNWRNYQQLRGVVHSRDGRGDPYMEPNDPEWSKWTPETRNAVGGGRGPMTNDQESWIVAFLDPRAPRLNMPARRDRILNESYFNKAIDTSPPAGPRFVDPINWREYVNNTLSSPSYTDRDGVRRVGDAAGWGATPLTPGAFTQRPLHLDRPFQSVGELGLVFRDDPWKTLNLISSNSADAGLLDLFFVGSGEKNSPAVIAGKVNLNTASPEVLKSLLSQVAQNVSSGNAVTSQSQINALADAITSRIQTDGPFVNLSDLTSVFPPGIATSAAFPGNKEQREALIRALTGSANLRTWNFLIDVIAQSGRFRPGATNLNDFVVEGERRYWLHVAIDRFTGKIVDQQLEPVFEW